MRIVFAGTPAPAVPSLRALAASAHEVVGVVTRADAPIGRTRVLTPSPVAQAAGELGLPIIKADRLDAAATEEITALGADLGVIVAYGGLVREPLLSWPRLGWINLHVTLLPRWACTSTSHSFLSIITASCTGVRLISSFSLSSASLRVWPGANCSVMMFCRSTR